MLKLEHSEAIGRVLRLDDLDTLGVSTQTLAEQAIDKGDWEQVRALADYFYDDRGEVGSQLHSRRLRRLSAAFYQPTTQSCRGWDSGGG